MKTLLLFFTCICCISFGQQTLNGRSEILDSSDAPYLKFEQIHVSDSAIYFQKNEISLRHFHIIQNISDTKFIVREQPISDTRREKKIMDFSVEFQKNGPEYTLKIKTLNTGSDFLNVVKIRKL